MRAAAAAMIAALAAILMPSAAGAAPLTGMSVTQGNYLVQGLGTVTVGFTTAQPVMPGGYVSVAFPAGYDLSTVVTGSNEVTFGGAVPFTGDSNTTVDLATNTVQVQLDNSSTDFQPGGKTITFNGVTNPVASSASSGSFTITTYNPIQPTPPAPWVALDTGTVDGPAILAGGLPDAFVMLGSSQASATTTVTVGFDTEQAVPNNGAIVVVFPDAFDVSGVGATAAYGGAVPFDGTNTVSVSGQTVTVTRTGGATTAAGAKTVALTGVVNPATARTDSGLFALRTTDGSATIDEGAAVGPAIAPSALTSMSATLARPTVGETGSMTLAFTTASSTPANATIRILMPPGFNLSFLGNTAAFSGAVPFTGTGSVSSDGQLITIRRSGGTATAAGAKSITLTGIRNPGHVGLFAPVVVTTLDSSSDLIASGTTSTTVTTPGSLTTLEVSPASTTVSAAGDLSVGFTTADMVPADGVIRITMPSGFVLSGAGVNPAFPSNPSTNFDGTATLSVDGNDLVIARNGDGTDSPSGAKRIVVTGIANPPTAGRTASFPIATSTRAGDQIDTGTAPAVTITAGAITAGQATPASLLTGANGNVSVTFTTANAIPADGRIVVTFPAGFNVAAASGATPGTGIDGTLAVTTSGQSVILTRSGGSDAAAGAKALTIAGITNPAYMGTTGTFGIRTESGASGFPDIDSGTAPAVEIEADTTDGAAAFTSDIAGSLSDMTYTWTVGANTIDSDGKILITMPSGFDLTRVGTVTLGGIDGTHSTTVNAGAGTILITRTAGTVASGTVSVTVRRLLMPSVSGPTAAIALQTQTSGGVAEENVSAEGVLVEPSVLRLVSARPAASPAGSTAAGAVGNFVVSFTTSNSLPADGEVEISLPTPMGVSEVGGSPVAMTGIDGNAYVSFDAATNTVTVTRSGGSPTPSAPGAKSITLSGIRNQPYAAVVGTVGVVTRAANGNAIDVGDVASPFSTTANVISDITWGSAWPIAGAVGELEIAFTTSNPIEEGQELLVELPAGFSLPDPDALRVYFDDPTLAQSAITMIGGRTFVFTRNDIGGPTPAGAKTMYLFGMRNPPRSGTTGPVSIATATATNQAIDLGTSPSGIQIEPADSDGTTVTATSLIAGDSTAVQADLTSSLSTPASAVIRMTFPAGFDLSQVGPTATTSFAGTNSVSVVGQAVLVTRTSGAAVPANTPMSISIPRVRNPGISGVTGDFLVDVETRGGDTLDVALADGITVTPGAMRLISATPSSAAAGATVPLTVGFTNANPIPGNGQIVISLPAGFDLARLASTAALSGMDGSAVVAANAAARTVTVTRVGGSTATTGVKSITLTGVTNPGTPGPTGALGIASSTAGGTAIDEGSIASAFTVAPAVEQASLRTAGLAFATLAPSGRGNVVVTIQTVNNLENDTSIAITFPKGFNVSQVGATAAYGGQTPFDGPNFVSASGQVVTIARRGGTTTGPGTKTITLTNVRNPSSAGSTGGFPISVVDPRGGVIESGTAAGVLIRRPARLVRPVRRTVSAGYITLTTRVRFFEPVPSSLIVRSTTRSRARVTQLPGTVIGRRVVRRSQTTATLRPTRANELVNLKIRVPRSTGKVTLQLVAATGNVKQTLTLR